MCLLTCEMLKKLLLIQEIVFDDEDLIDIDQVVTFLCN